MTKSKKKTKWANTLNPRRSCEHIRDHGFHSKARVELYFDNDESGKRYGIVEMNHYHAIPNLVLIIKEITDGEAR